MVEKRLTIPIPRIADRGMEIAYIHRQPASTLCSSKPARYPNKIPTTIRASFRLIKVPTRQIQN